jgi:hypothetical protein
MHSAARAGRSRRRWTTPVAVSVSPSQRKNGTGGVWRAPPVLVIAFDFLGFLRHLVGPVVGGRPGLRQAVSLPEVSWSETGREPGLKGLTCDAGRSDGAAVAGEWDALVLRGYQGRPIPGSRPLPASHQ